MTELEIFKKLLELKERDIAVCLATIIETMGSTPREIGAKMIICVDGTIYGSIGGGCGENQVRSAALRSTLVTQKPQILEIDLTDDLGTKGWRCLRGKTVGIYRTPLKNFAKAAVNPFSFEKFGIQLLKRLVRTLFILS